MIAERDLAADQRASSRAPPPGQLPFHGVGRRHVEPLPRRQRLRKEVARFVGVDQFLSDGVGINHHAHRDEGVPVRAAGYSLVKPVRSLVIVKLPSVRADSFR